MSELFEDSDEDKAVIMEDNLGEVEEIIDAGRIKQMRSDARRRLEALMEEKRLESELDDWS